MVNGRTEARPTTAGEILLADDDAELCEMVKDLLTRKEGFSVDAVRDGRKALALAVERRFDLILLDVMLPVLDGFQVLRQLRKREYVPIIMLTARSEREDRVVGLDLGADDYLPKPFWPDELTARVKAVLRRTRHLVNAKVPTIEVGRLKINSDIRHVWVDTKQLEITSTEFDILELLARSRGRVVSRDEIAAVLYQRAATPFERSLDVHMSHLRKKVGEGEVVIRTIRNVGYMLNSASGEEA
jgi:two-component system response regulator CpxR